MVQPVKHGSFVTATDLFQIMACLYIGCSEIAYFPVLFSSGPYLLVLTANCQE